ncbi:DUF6283 family protein [Nonomuraea sp. NPDC003707]
MSASASPRTASVAPIPINTTPHPLYNWTPCPLIPGRPSQYKKLRGYDQPTFAQPVTLWLCHHHDRNSPRRQVCAGWAGCHDGATLLAVRVALVLRSSKGVGEPSA